MTTPAYKLPPDALPYFRAGLRGDDALAAARVARRFMREQRAAAIRHALDNGASVELVAQVFGVSLSTVRRCRTIDNPRFARTLDHAAELAACCTRSRQSGSRE